MSYRESRARWRKLWRKEPENRRTELSFNARACLAHLLAHADDAGCLGPVTPGKHPFRTLAQRLTVATKDRRDFNRRIQELIDYGDDGQPLALVIQAGHLFLTRFEECQAKRHQPKPSHSASHSLHHASTTVEPKPPESFNTETDLATEVRSKKIEVLINREAETNAQPSPPSPSSDPDGKTYDAETLQREVDERRKALGHRPLRWAGKHLDARTEIVALAAEHSDLVEHAFDTWCADESQRQHGHIPSGLVMHWPRYTAELKQRQHAQQRQLRGAQRALEYYQDLARAGGQRVPMSLAELEPGYLEKIRDEYPGLDLSQVRSRPRVVAAEPEQRGGEPGNVADDLGLAKCLANPEI